MGDLPEHAREFPRFEVNAYVDYTGNEVLLFHRIQNISLGGVCIQTSGVEEVGTMVDLVLNFPDLDASIAVTGEVVWANREPPMDMGSATSTSTKSARTRSASTSTWFASRGRREARPPARPTPGDESRADPAQAIVSGGQSPPSIPIKREENRWPGGPGCGEAVQVALIAFPRGGAGPLLEVDVGDAGDGETAGREAELGAEAGALLGGGRARGRRRRRGARG